MEKTQLFISGIGTEIGKTVVSSIFVKAFNAHYWKPVQSGELDHSDSQKVQKLSSSHPDKILSERFRLKSPLSPHTSAEIDGINIQLQDFSLPSIDNHLIIEGAGGLMVPLNQKDLLIDLIALLNIPVVLVSQNYLGSINHTILSYEALNARNIPIAGLVFNGPRNDSGKAFIANYTRLPILLEINQEDEVNASMVNHYARILESNWETI